MALSSCCPRFLPQNIITSVMIRPEPIEPQDRSPDMTPSATPARYKHHRFPGEIIRHGVWLYYRFTLSYRDVQELLFARGIVAMYGAMRK